MDETIVVGQKILGSFREQLTVSDIGLSYHGIFVPWVDVSEIRLMSFEDYQCHWRAGQFVSRGVKWYKMTVMTNRWISVLDSRVTVRPGDSIQSALGVIATSADKNINAAFVKVKELLEKYCPDKIKKQTAFAGSFDFQEWTSWVGAILVILLIGGVLSIICNALRPLFR